jgi:hypothetical protein
MPNLQVRLSKGLGEQILARRGKDLDFILIVYAALHFDDPDSARFGGAAS